MPRKKRQRQPTFLLRLRPGRDDDLIRWLEGLPDGSRSQAVREALRRGISGGRSDPSPQPVALDLAAIRAVVEAAVFQALGSLEGVQVARAASQEDEEVEALLDDLGASLVLGGDEAN